MNENLNFNTDGGLWVWWGGSVYFDTMYDFYIRGVRVARLARNHHGYVSEYQRNSSLVEDIPGSYVLKIYEINLDEIDGIYMHFNFKDKFPFDIDFAFISKQSLKELINNNKTITKYYTGSFRYVDSTSDDPRNVLIQGNFYDIKVNKNKSIQMGDNYIEDAVTFHQ